jgi:hypothetical protein
MLRVQFSESIYQWLVARLEARVTGYSVTAVRSYFEMDANGLPPSVDFCAATADMQVVFLEGQHYRQEWMKFFNSPQ